MKLNRISSKFISICIGAMLCFSALSVSANAPLPETFADEKIVLQISDPDPFKQTLVLNVAGNLLRHYSATEADIEIVGFGPGVRLMFAENVNDKRIQALIDSGVRFSACKNTIRNMAKVLGKEPNIRDGITRVPSGAARLLQLKKAGWELLKP